MGRMGRLCVVVDLGDSYGRPWAAWHVGTGWDVRILELDRTPPTAHISLRTVILQDPFDFLTS